MLPPESARYGVVVINWNGADDTLACLESLHAATPRPNHVVVVDNCSADDSLDRIRNWAAAGGVPLLEMDADAGGEPRWLTLIRSTTNRGYSGGNNVGLRFLREHSDATHFLLLNNDATVAADFFREMNAALDDRPDAGLLTGTIYQEPARHVVWYAGGRTIPLRALVAHNDEVPASPAPVPTEFVSGCAMLISRRVLDSNGLLPECYFPLYSEDAEYSYRALRNGFPVLYAPRAIVYHRIGSAVGQARTSPSVTRCQVRHRFFYVRRNFEGMQRRAALAYLVITKPGKAIVEALSGRPRMGWAVFMGLVDGLTRRV